jgi:hypothetical protein
VAGIEIAEGEMKGDIADRTDELTRVANPGKFIPESCMKTNENPFPKR